MNIFDFSIICERIPLSICPALKVTDSDCFARNVSIGSWLMFQPGKELQFFSICLRVFLMKPLWPSTLEPL